MRVIKIGIESVECVEIEPTLDALQEQVGGYIQYLPVVDGIAAYIDEEAKFKPDAKVNPVATGLAHSVIGIASDDVIVGTMLLVGDDGEADVPESAMQLVTACREGVQGNA